MRTRLRLFALGSVGFLTLGLASFASATGVASLAGTASAQPCGYPPSNPCPTTTVGPPAGAPNLGTIGVGQSSTVPVCGYTPGSTVTVTVDGQPGGTLTVGANGCVTLVLAVVSTTKAQVNGDTVNITCGANSVVVSGTSSSGAALTQTVPFSVNCAVSESGVAFSGANVARWSVVGVALIAFGFLMFAAVRRRTSDQA